jgi:hypothetical protein
MNMGHKHAVYIRVISDFRREVDEILTLEGGARYVVPKRQ